MVAYAKSKLTWKIWWCIIKFKSVTNSLVTNDVFYARKIGFFSPIITHNHSITVSSLHTSPKTKTFQDVEKCLDRTVKPLKVVIRG